MSITQTIHCYSKALNLLIEYKYLTDEDFVKMLTAMNFTKDIIFAALNDLCEHPLVEYKLGEFRLDVAMNYEAMWNELKNKIESDLKYHQNKTMSSATMQSVSESIECEIKYREMLNYMKKIEEQYK